MPIYRCKEDIHSLGIRIYITGTSGVNGRVHHEPFSFPVLRKE